MNCPCCNQPLKKITSRANRYLHVLVGAFQDWLLECGYEWASNFATCRVFFKEHFHTFYRDGEFIAYNPETEQEEIRYHWRSLNQPTDFQLLLDTVYEFMDLNGIKFESYEQFIDNEKEHRKITA